jgi:hypothetical protein
MAVGDVNVAAKASIIPIIGTRIDLTECIYVGFNIFHWRGTGDTITYDFILNIEFNISI